MPAPRLIEFMSGAVASVKGRPMRHSSVYRMYAKRCVQGANGPPIRATFSVHPLKPTSLVHRLKPGTVKQRALITLNAEMPRA